MSETHRITIDPNQCGGRPCLRHLRIRVKDVLDLTGRRREPGRNSGRLSAARSWRHHRRPGIRR